MRYVARGALIVAFMMVASWTYILANIVLHGQFQLAEPNRFIIWSEFGISVLILLALAVSYLMLVLQDIKGKKK